MLVIGMALSGCATTMIEAQPITIDRDAFGGQALFRGSIAAIDGRIVTRRGQSTVLFDRGVIPLPPITGTRIVKMPPLPVTDPSECPLGSSRTFGLCRTPEGYMRPLPEWLVEFLEQDR